MSTSFDFRQIYCLRNGISKEDFAEHLLQKTLPAHARAFRFLWSLTFVNKNHFRSDFDFIHNVGCLRKYRDFNQTVREFYVHPWNQCTLLREVLGIRVSTNRVRQIVLYHFKTKAKAESEDTLAHSSDPVTFADAPACASHTKEILSNGHILQINGHLKPIATKPTTTHPPEPVSQQAHSTSASVKMDSRQFDPRHNRPHSETTQKCLTRSATDTEIDVLRVVNEHLKCELTRSNAQRDVLKNAASICVLVNNLANEVQALHPVHRP